MKQTKTKVLSLLAAAAMTVGMLPQNTPLSLLRPVLTASAASGGKCGTNVSWALDDSGTLTVSGSGEMKNYGSEQVSEQAPWLAYRDDIKKVIVEKGVTTLCTNAFQNCAMESAALPEGLESISDSAFHYCESLKEIKIPSTVKTIGFEAFKNSYL